MIISPLIFSTLVVGIAGAGHFKAVGRMSVRADRLLRGRDDAGAAHRPRRRQRPPAGRGRGARRREVDAWRPTPRRGIRSSSTRSRRRSSTRWRRTTCSRSSSSASSSPSGSAMVGEKGKPVITLCEGIAEAMFKVTGDHHALRADRRLRGAGVHGERVRRRPAAQPRVSDPDALPGADRVLPARAAAGGAALQGADPEVHQGRARAAP